MQTLSAINNCAVFIFLQQYVRRKVLNARKCIAQKRHNVTYAVNAIQQHVVDKKIYRQKYVIIAIQNRYVVLFSTQIYRFRIGTYRQDRYFTLQHQVGAMALQFRGAYVQDGVKRFATTSRVGEQRNREKEGGTNVRECPNEKGFIKNRCRHPGPHFRFVSWSTSNFYDASNSRRDSSIFQMKTFCLALIP